MLNTDFRKNSFRSESLCYTCAGRETDKPNRGV